MRFILNLIWLVLCGFWMAIGYVVAGVWLAIGHTITGVAMCLTIIGIPLGIASFKMVPISLLPLGREIVPSDQVFYAPTA